MWTLLAEQGIFDGVFGGALKGAIIGGVVGAVVGIGLWVMRQFNPEPPKDGENQPPQPPDA